MSIMFNQICINEEMLPIYIYIYIGTPPSMNKSFYRRPASHFYVYIYIYIYIYIKKSISLTIYMFISFISYIYTHTLSTCIIWINKSMILSIYLSISFCSCLFPAPSIIANNGITLTILHVTIILASVSSISVTILWTIRTTMDGENLPKGYIQFVAIHFVLNSCQPRPTTAGDRSWVAFYFKWHSSNVMNTLFLAFDGFWTMKGPPDTLLKD